MDGLLINSEDIYTIALTEALKRFGKGPLTWDVKVNLQGRPGPDAARCVIEHYDLPLEPEELFKLTTEIQGDLWPSVSFMPGALELIEYLSESGVPIALATSSHSHNFRMKTNHLPHGFKHFRHHVVTGDDVRIPKGRGKPFPDIWHTALKSLNAERSEAGLGEIDISECLIFEDGVPGVHAGKAAGGFVIWVPDKRALQVLGDQFVPSLIGANNEHGLVLESLADFEKSDFGL